MGVLLFLCMSMASLIFVTMAMPMIMFLVMMMMLMIMNPIYESCMNFEVVQGSDCASRARTDIFGNLLHLSVLEISAENIDLETDSTIQ